jgi:hypothetical protein
MTPRDDGAHLLDTLPPDLRMICADVAQAIPCAAGQAVMAALLLMDQALGDQVHLVDPDGQRMDLLLDPHDFAGVFVDLSAPATARLFATLRDRLQPALERMVRNRRPLSEM